MLPNCPQRLAFHPIFNQIWEGVPLPYDLLMRLIRLFFRLHWEGVALPNCSYTPTLGDCIQGPLELHAALPADLDIGSGVQQQL